MPIIPVIFTVFANPHGDLENLKQEQNGIQDKLLALDQQHKIKHLIRTDTDLTSYFDFMQQFKNQMRIFHYAGHANSEILSLQNANTFFAPLAEELILRNKESLRLVFLNGCSTKNHVQTLFDLGAPAVIATSVPINDNTAMLFSIRFYHNLAGGDNIENAYISAANYAKANSTDKRFKNFGAPAKRWVDVTGSENDSGEFPWGLYINEGVNLAGEKLLPAEEVAVTISLDDFKKQMLALVDEGEFGQIYDAIRKSPYTYQKFLLNKSEQEMAYGASLALVSSLRVFIGSLRETK